MHKCAISLSMCLLTSISSLFSLVFLSCLVSSGTECHRAVRLPCYLKQTEHLSWALLFWLHAQNPWSSFIMCSLKRRIFAWTFVRIFQSSVRRTSEIYQSRAGSTCYSHAICLLKKHYSVPLSSLCIWRVQITHACRHASIQVINGHIDMWHTCTLTSTQILTVLSVSVTNNQWWIGPFHFKQGESTCPRGPLCVEVLWSVHI